MVLGVGPRSLRPVGWTGPRDASMLGRVTIADALLRDHTFLADMVDDEYFPRPLVAAGQAILVELCEAIERERPRDRAGVYALTRAATERFNELAGEYEEIETVAREAIAADVALILSRFGLDFDLEEAIANREW